MIRLTYVSTCKTGLVLADVRAILAVATKSNAANGITGMLYRSAPH
jgi:Sensors of blue-light using FAD